MNNCAYVHVMSMTRITRIFENEGWSVFSPSLPSFHPFFLKNMKKAKTWTSPNGDAFSVSFLLVII